MGRPILKTVTNIKKKAWSAFSVYIRRKYASPSGFCTCYTCGKRYKWKNIQAGHGFAGRGGAILFEEDVVRPQCYACNILCHGRLDIFTHKLVEELGYKRFSELYQQHFQPKTWTVEELWEIWENYESKNRALNAI